MSFEAEPAPPVAKFPHRSRRGLMLGMSPAQLAAAAMALGCVMVSLTSGGLILAAELFPLWALAAGLVWVRRGGMAVVDWVPVLARYVLRRARGQLTWLARPATRPVKEGLLHLPGAAGSLRVVSAPGNEFAAIHDPHAGTLTVVARVASRAFALLDPSTQTSHVEGWGRTLAALARAGHVRAIQVLERTVPDSGDALARHFTDYRRPGPAAAHGIYGDLVEQAGPAAAPHETYVALAFDLRAARRLVTEAGGGLSGAFAVLGKLAAVFNQSARQSGLISLGWLGPKDIAAVVRTAYDPAALPALQRWSPAPLAQAAPHAAGPVVQVEEPERLRTDSAHHTTYWVENWPRVETSPGFLHQVMFCAGVRRSLSLTYRPASVDAALRDVQRRKASIVAEAGERRRRGRVETEAHSLEYADVQERERQLIAGHADVAFTGLITVSADTPDLLRSACAHVETAAVNAQIDLRRLTFRQAQAFTAAALPLARPL